MCQELTTRRIPIHPEPMGREGDLPWFVTDTSKISEATGWTPQHSVKTTLQEILEWLKENQQLLRSILN